MYTSIEDKEQPNTQPQVFNCPLCLTALNETLEDSAILFVCPNCGFKILTTKELFPRCFKKRTSVLSCFDL